MPPAPQPHPVAPPPQGLPPSSYGLGGDATVLRPGALNAPVAPVAPSAPGGAEIPPASAPLGGAAAPPPPVASWSGDLEGSATVAHGRHAPAIEAADLSPAVVEAGPPKALRVAAIVGLLVLLAGAGFLGWNRMKNGAADVGAGPPSTVRAGDPQTPPTPVRVPDPSSPTTAAGGPPTTAGILGTSGTPGTLPPEAYGPPTDVAITVTTPDSVQVTWRDASGGKLPFVYQVLSPDGQKLTAKISSVRPGTTSLTVTSVDDGPLKTAAVNYCVAVGTITGAAKPLWAEAPCTDGTSVKVS